MTDAPGGLRHGADPGGETYKDMLSTAARLFRELGYSATSTRGLAQEVGLRPSSMYHYIESKEDLLFHVCLQSLKSISHAVEVELDDLEDPVERLQAFVRAHVQTSLAERDFHATMLFELRSLSAEHRNTVISRRDAYEQLLQDIVEDGVSSGQFTDRIPPRVMVLLILNLLNWSIFWYEPSRGLTPAAIASFAATLCLNGVLAAK